jgi:hypothetical protein
MEQVGRIFTPEGDIFGIPWSAGNKGEKERRAATTQNEIDEPVRQAEAEQKVLLEKQKEEEKSAAKRAAAAKPTIGFGANTNLARTFLTSL